MAINESVFADYNAAIAPTQDVGIAGFAPQQALEIPQVQAPAPVQTAQATNPLAEVGQHPVFQFYDKWKKSSPEMRKSAEKKIAVDFPGGARDMGLPDPTADEAGEALARKEGKEVKQDKGAWGKFMKFIDGNPQFLLDLGAQLLAPRSAGTSQAGQIASGLLGATNRLQARKAAGAKAALDKSETEAGIEKTLATASESPSKIKLNLARAAAEKAGAGGKTAASVQLLDKITESMMASGKYTTADEARLAAQRTITGKAPPEEQAFYDYWINNLDPTLEGAQELLANAPNPTNIRDQKAKADRKRKLQKAIVSDPVKLRASIETRYPNYNAEQVEAEMARRRKAFGVGTPTKATPTVGTLSEDLAGRKTAAKEKKTSKAARQRVGKQLTKWRHMTRPDAQGMISMTPAEAKKIRAQIDKEYESYSAKERERAQDLVEILDSKFL